MNTTRLSDAEIDELLCNALQNDGQVERWLDLERSIRLLIEIRDRRAITIDEVRDALKHDGRVRRDAEKTLKTRGRR